jgi:sortase A
VSPAVRRAGRAIARSLGDLCVTVGALVLLFVVWQLWWTDLSAGRTQQALTHELQQQWDDAPPVAVPGAGPVVAGDPAPPTPPLGEPFALIHVPRFGADYVRPVLQGTTPEVLEEGVGHYEGTAGPGQVGNFAVAGHRVTYAKPFNEIDRLQAGDAVVVETQDSWYVYTVRSHQVVSPHQVDAVSAVPGRPGARATARMLTLTACHPEFSARERYVVLAELDRTLAKEDGRAPAVLAAPASARAGR